MSKRSVAFLTDKISLSLALKSLSFLLTLRCTIIFYLIEGDQVRMRLLLASIVLTNVVRVLAAASTLKVLRLMKIVLIY